MTNPELLLAGSALVAGTLNSIAGGGTLLTFPTLLGVVSPAVANATSTVALLPGSLAGATGYRTELTATRVHLRWLVPVSFLGGLLGAALLVAFPDAFAALVPWLILTAAILFLLQPLLARWKRRRQPTLEILPASQPSFGVIAFQFCIAVYGGYFGAGIGILMLTALSFLNLGSIHHANALKTVLAAVINAVSVLVFIAAGLVHWYYAAVMAGAAILGGYFGARIARRLPTGVVRTAVILIGFGLAAYYFT
ncbi:MAG: sulfite exporter TauE/SafE family protein, partial [Gemmataceae bacterium]